MKNLLTRFCTLAAVVLPALVQTTPMAAQPPQANTVPFVASNPTSPHTSWSGNMVTLKGTLTTTPANAGDSFSYVWNTGGGVPAQCGPLPVTKKYDIECSVTYTGPVNTVYVAVLTITDTTTTLVSPVS